LANDPREADDAQTSGGYLHNDHVKVMMPQTSGVICHNGHREADDNVVLLCYLAQMQRQADA